MLTIHGLSDFHRKITVNIRTPSTDFLMYFRLVWQPSANQRFGYSIQICSYLLVLSSMSHSIGSVKIWSPLKLSRFHKREMI